MMILEKDIVRNHLKTAIVLSVCGAVALIIPQLLLLLFVVVICFKVGTFLSTKTRKRSSREG